MKDTIVQVALLIFTGAAIYLSQSSGELPRYACLVGLISNAVWFYESYAKKQWGVFVLTIFTTYSWLLGLEKYWL